MIKKLMLGTALGALMVSGAIAQSAPPASGGSAPVDGQNFVQSQKPDQWLATNFKGTDVLGANNEKIGDVSDILFDKNGKIEAFIIGVGGFLGVGEKDVALAPASFEVVPGDKAKGESDKLKLSMSKDQLKQAQNFEPYQAPRTTTGSGGPGTLGGSGIAPSGSTPPATNR